jgi:RNA ligase (TIGR02306 family)
MFFKYDLNKKLESLTEDDVALVGEVLGVQDLKYDAKNDQTFRAFGVKIKNTWLDHGSFVEFCEKLDIPHVPILYKGPFSEEVLKEFTSGKTTIEGASHIREGLVITPAKERVDLEIGRVILKSISEDYLLRKEGTEFV